MKYVESSVSSLCSSSIEMTQKCIGDRIVFKCRTRQGYNTSNEKLTFTLIIKYKRLPMVACKYLRKLRVVINFSASVLSLPELYFIAGKRNNLFCQLELSTVIKKLGIIKCTKKWVYAT